MNECYSAALSANTTTLVALLVGAVLGLIVIKVASVIAERRAIRRDHKRIDKLMADTEAELKKYRADHDH
ncbi:LapA family protein [Corynebacterium pseudodiphtheriticum]|uniref:LapA family protein n=1 Tax=Corynebacterium pseudodiphtheriticum TaxID=37637 RepID=UPI00254BC9D5|nr:LapA family protein [Corynebacterium pseudodiphtheriticum]MDK8486207.1 LapA family protein [Corynebacterium pseudodiphtheriticum]MDK8493646.1 LapA family protein [Corynebacterium pseudodiphtheriticum]